MHSHDEDDGAIQMEDLQLEMKAAGFTQERQAKIVQKLSALGMQDTVPMFDYLVFKS